MAGKHPVRERKRCLEILGLSDGAKEDEIKKAYKKLALQFHPDKNDSADAKEKFQEISYAYKYLIEGPSAIGGDHPGAGDGIPMDILTRLFPWILQDLGYMPSFGGGVFGGGLLDELFGMPRRRSFVSSPFPFFMDSGDDFSDMIFMESYDDHDPSIYHLGSHGYQNRHRRQGGRSHFQHVNRNNSSSYSNFPDSRTSKKKSTSSSYNNSSSKYPSSGTYSTFDGGLFSTPKGDHNSGVQKERDTFENNNVELPPQGKKKRKKKKKKDTEVHAEPKKEAEAYGMDNSKPSDNNTPMNNDQEESSPTATDDKDSNSSNDQLTAESQHPKRLNKKERRKLQREQARKAMGLDHTCVMKEAESKRRQGPAVTVRDLGDDEDDMSNDSSDDDSDDDNSDRLETKTDEKKSRRMRKNQKRKQRSEEVEPPLETSEFNSSFFPSRIIDSSNDYDNLHPQTAAEEEEMLKLALEMSKAEEEEDHTHDISEHNESFKPGKTTPHSKPTYVPVLNSKLPSLDQLSLRGKQSQDRKQGAFVDINSDNGQEGGDNRIDKTLIDSRNRDSQFYDEKGKVDVIEDIVRKKTSPKGSTSWHDSIGQTPFFKENQSDEKDNWEFTKTYYNKGQRASTLHNLTDAYGSLNSDTDPSDYSSKGSDYFDNSKAFDIYGDTRQTDQLSQGHQGRSSTSPGQPFPVMSSTDSKPVSRSEEKQKEIFEPLNYCGKTVTDQETDMFFHDPQNQYYSSQPSYSMTGQRSRPLTASKEPYMNSYVDSGSAGRSSLSGSRDRANAKTMETSNKPYSPAAGFRDNQHGFSTNQYYETTKFPASSEYMHTDKTYPEPLFNTIYEKDETGKPRFHVGDQFHNKGQYFSKRNKDSGKQYIPIHNLSRKYDTQSSQYLDKLGKQFPKSGFTNNCAGNNERNVGIDSVKSSVDILDSIDDPAIVTPSQQNLPVNTGPYGNVPYRPSTTTIETPSQQNLPVNTGPYGTPQQNLPVNTGPYGNVPYRPSTTTTPSQQNLPVNTGPYGNVPYRPSTTTIETPSQQNMPVNTGPYGNVTYRPSTTTPGYSTNPSAKYGRYGNNDNGGQNVHSYNTNPSAKYGRYGNNDNSGKNVHNYSTNPSTKHGHYGNNDNGGHNVHSTSNNQNSVYSNSQGRNAQHTQHYQGIINRFSKENNLDDIDDVDLSIDSPSCGRNYGNNGVRVDLQDVLTNDGLHIPQGIQLDQARKMYKKK